MQSKICVFVIFSLLLLGGGLRAQEASYLRFQNEEPAVVNHKWSGAWKGKLGGVGLNEGKNEGAAAAFELDTRFDYELVDWARLHVEPEVEMFSSRVQQRFDEDEYQNRFRLDSAYVEVKPTRYTIARAGAIDQEFLDFDILISRHRTFPGAQEIFTTDRMPVNVKLIAQQLVPTSYSLNTDRQDKEPLPSFQTQSLQVDGLLPDMGFMVMGGHYSWTNLPDKVAAQSFIAGNTPNNGEAVAGSKFKYDFDGLFWRAGFSFLPVSKLKIDLSYMGEHNMRAPGDKADGQLWQIRPTWRIGRRELSFAYSNFFIEPDATVGVYARSLLGYANRIGDLYEVEYNLKDLGWYVKGEFCNARTLNDRANQQTYTEYKLWVGTSYASF